MSLILETTARILAEVDRALEMPSGVCLVCGVPSQREWCGKYCRHQLWAARRGIEARFDLFADRRDCR